MAKDNKYISDVIDYSIIDKNYFLFIKSGVGSGKTTMVRNIVKGTLNGQKERKKILFLTSRTVAKQDMLKCGDLFTNKLNAKYGNVWLDKADYIMHHYYYYDIIDIDYRDELDYLQTDNGRYNKSVSLSYYLWGQIVKYLANTQPEQVADGYDFIWQLFDVVVLDEVHTLLLEATYQDCAYPVFDLLRWIANNKARYTKKRVILLSATPDCIINHLFAVCGSSLKVQDLSSKCISAKPRRVEFISQLDKKVLINELYKEGHKIVDFYQGRALTIMQAIDGTEIAYDDALSLVSRWSSTKLHWQSMCLPDTRETISRMDMADEEILTRHMLPEHYRYICTTSTYSEAVTWDNRDIDYMFVDSHVPERVVQCCGRLRKSDYTLVIVVDSYQYRDSAEQILALDDDSEEHNVILASRHIINKQQYIDDVLTQYSGLTYDYREDKFVNYDMRIDSARYLLDAIDKWDNIDIMKLNCYRNTVKQWFGNDMEVAEYESKEHMSKYVLDRVYKIKQGTPKSGPYYTPDKIEHLRATLSEIWHGDYTINHYITKFAPNYHFIRLRKEYKHCGMYIFAHNNKQK